VHRLCVADVRPLTSDAVCITFEVPDELRDEYWFKQGQHVTLIHRENGEELRRSYSICSAAGTGPLRVAVKRVSGGRFSTWATTELRAGDVLGVMTPNGRFSANVNPAHDKRYVAVAGGSGITPILSNIATVLAVERRSSVTLLNVNRRQASVMLSDELEALVKRHGDRFAIHHVYSREARSDGRPAGRLDRDALVRLFGTTIPAARVDEWLLCGPEGLVEQARSALTELGVNPRRVQHELFAIADAKDDDVRDAPDLACDVTILLNGRATDVTLRADGASILDAILPQRPEAPYSCRDGVCSTCRAKLLEGDVHMRRSSGLDADERHEGYVLTCQAHPLTKRVLLDFDV
jgi:ring-1,2-phenylacetyl-CoA epoxidase subunit PaaE